MGFRYVGNGNTKRGSHLNWSGSKRGLNTSYTLDLGFAKWNIPIIGTSVKRKSRVTLKGSGVFRLKG
jgi:hypothetical protein